MPAAAAHRFDAPNIHCNRDFSEGDTAGCLDGSDDRKQSRGKAIRLDNLSLSAERSLLAGVAAVSGLLPLGLPLGESSPRAFANQPALLLGERCVKVEP